MSAYLQMTPAEMAQYIFDRRNHDNEFKFFAEYDTESNEASYAFLVKIFDFADTRCVIINYIGGGNMFCYEFGDDSDSSGLISLLQNYAFHCSFADACWLMID